MKTISIPGAQLSYVDRGQGLPLLLVHGFPLDHTMWTRQIDALAQQCRVLAPDLRGFGKSRASVDEQTRDYPDFRANENGTPPFSASKITMTDFADDLAALLDALGIVEPIVLCGLSMGGYIALQFWRKYAARLRGDCPNFRANENGTVPLATLRGLILCDTRAAADQPEAAAARRAMAERVLREGPAPQVEAMLPRVVGDTTRRLRPHLVESLRRTMLSTSPQTIAAAQRGMAERPDMTATLGQIACPTLVVVGAEDATSPPAEMRAMAQAIPASRFVEIPESGHMSPIENPAAVNAALAEFLAGLSYS